MTIGYEKVSKWRDRTCDAINYIMGGKCVICGYDKTYYSLHYHHIDPTLKTFNLSKVRTATISWDAIENELRNCVIVCANCHGEIHAGVIPAPKESSFSEERLRELHKPCKNNCGKLVHHRGHDFCSKSCRSKYVQEQISDKNSRQEKSVWNTVNVIELLNKYHGNMCQAAKAVGVSDNTVRNQLRKLTNCKNWLEYKETQ